MRLHEAQVVSATVEAIVAGVAEAAVAHRGVVAEEEERPEVHVAEDEEAEEARGAARKS